MLGPYVPRMVELAPPTSRLHAAWLTAHLEWGPGLHEDGFGLLASDEVVSPKGFANWVTRLHAESACLGDGTEHRSAESCIYRWIVDGDRVFGGIALRLGDSEFINRAGHIGYGICPSARRRGLATWALRKILGHAQLLGMERALLVCDADNRASSRMIERAGGVLDRVDQTEEGSTRRYSIATA